MARTSMDDDTDSGNESHHPRRGNGHSGAKQEQIKEGCTLVVGGEIEDGECGNYQQKILELDGTEDEAITLDIHEGGIGGTYSNANG